MQIGTIKEIWRYPVKSMGGEQVESTFIQSKGIADDRCWSVRDDTTGELVGGRKIPGLMMLKARYLEQSSIQFGKPAETVIEIAFPDGQALRSDDPYASAMLSMYLGKQVSLVSRPTPANKSAYKLAKPMTPAEVKYALGMKPDAPDPDFSSFSLGMLTTLSRYATPPGVLYDVYPLHLLTTAALQWIGQFHPEGDFSVRRYRPSFLIETDPALEGIVENDWRGRDLQIGELRIHCNHPTIRCSMPGAAQPGLAKDPNIPLTLMKHAGQHLGAYATPLNQAEIREGDTIELLPEHRSKLYFWFDQIGRRAKAEVLKVNTVLGNLMDNQAGSKPGTALPPGFSPYKVMNKQSESADVVSITLGRTDGKPAPRFVPGQHVVLAIPQGKGQYTFRPYSLSSSSNATGHYRVSVKLKSGPETDKSQIGEGSGFIHNQLQKGDEVYLKGPAGQFAALPTTNTPLVMICSGIGITPFLSILHSIAAENPTRSVHLVHGIRSLSNFPFQTELAELQAKLPHLKLQVWVSGEATTDLAAAAKLTTKVNAGRINLPLAIEAIQDCTEATFMICGTPEFSKTMREDLLHAGISPERVKTESFGPSLIHSDTGSAQYAITFSQSKKKVIWASNGESLLTLAEEQGLPASSGCRYGACQACEVTLLSGEVSYPEGILPPAGKNKILLCSALPASDLEIAM